MFAANPRIQTNNKRWEKRHELVFPPQQPKSEAFQRRKERSRSRKEKKEKLTCSRRYPPEDAAWRTTTDNPLLFLTDDFGTIITNPSTADEALWGPMMNSDDFLSPKRHEEFLHRAAQTASPPRKVRYYKDSIVELRPFCPACCRRFSSSSRGETTTTTPQLAPCSSSSCRPFQEIPWSSSSSCNIKEYRRCDSSSLAPAVLGRWIKPWTWDYMAKQKQQHPPAHNNIGPCLPDLGGCYSSKADISQNTTTYNTTSSSPLRSTITTEISPLFHSAGGESLQEHGGHSLLDVVLLSGNTNTTPRWNTDKDDAPHHFPSKDRLSLFNVSVLGEEDMTEHFRSIITRNPEEDQQPHNAGLVVVVPGTTTTTFMTQDGGVPPVNNLPLSPGDQRLPSRRNRHHSDHSSLRMDHSLMYSVDNSLVDDCLEDDDEEEEEKSMTWDDLMSFDDDDTATTDSTAPFDGLEDDDEEYEDRDHDI